MALDKSIKGSKFEVKVTGDENINIVFCAYLRQTWLDLCIKLRPKWMITAHSTHIVE